MLKQSGNPNSSGPESNTRHGGIPIQPEPILNSVHPPSSFVRRNPRFPDYLSCQESITFVPLCLSGDERIMQNKPNSKNLKPAQPFIYARVTKKARPNTLEKTNPITPHTKPLPPMRTHDIQNLTHVQISHRHTKYAKQTQFYHAQATTEVSFPKNQPYPCWNEVEIPRNIGILCNLTFLCAYALVHLPLRCNRAKQTQSTQPQSKRNSLSRKGLRRKFAPNPHEKTNPIKPNSSRPSLGRSRSPARGHDI